jgi:gas vesicle protein
MSDNSSRIVAALLLGGAVGAAIALLYAPKSGRKTRKDIAKAANRARDSVVDLADETARRVNDFVGEVRDRAEGIIDLGSSVSENARKEVIKALDSGQKAFEQQKKRIMKGIGLKG